MAISTQNFTLIYFSFYKLHGPYISDQSAHFGFFVVFIYMMKIQTGWMTLTTYTTAYVMFVISHKFTYAITSFLNSRS